MKKLGIALVGVLLFAACQRKEVTVNVTVKDKTLDSVSISVMDMDTILALNAEGKATVTVPVKEAQYGMAQYKWKQSPVYFEPGKDLNITWDMTPSELTIAFEGENADKNDFINGKELKGPVMRDYGRSEEELMKQLEEYQTEDFKILENKGFDKVFVEKEKQRIAYWIYGILWQYASSKECSEATYEKLQSLVSEDEWLLQLSEYINYMRGVISVMANRGANTANLSGAERTVNEMEYMVKNFKSQKIKDFLLSVTAISYVNNSGVNNAMRIKELAEKNISDKEMLNEFETAFANGSTLAKGCASPDFKMTSIDGKEYTLADFKGQYVYIDIWATWCVPCQEELPKLKVLEEMLKDYNIAFVSMSIDKDKAAWEKQVKEQKLGGVQLHAGQDNKFCEDYKVKGIPHFILIDPEGNIVEANMTRPSEDKTIELLGSIVSLVQ